MIFGQNRGGVEILVGGRVPPWKRWFWKSPSRFMPDFCDIKFGGVRKHRFLGHFWGHFCQGYLTYKGKNLNHRGLYRIFSLNFWPHFWPFLGFWAFSWKIDKNWPFLERINDHQRDRTASFEYGNAKYFLIQINPRRLWAKNVRIQRIFINYRA